MVAGAGGGGYESYESQNISNPVFKRYGEAGGGLMGYQGFQMNYQYGNAGTGGTQTSGGYSECLESENCLAVVGVNSVGSFGVAGSMDNFNGCTGGGSGYFGGGGSTHVQGSGGGSSYISGHNGCVAIEESSTVNNITFPTKNGVACTDGTTDQDCSVHYSGKEFTDTVMIDGKGYKWTTEKGSEVVGIPTHSGTSTMIGNGGDGYAKITLEDSVLCKRATTLHTTTCNSAESTKACRKNEITGYSVGDTIVYDNIPNNKNYKSGDAFDCDVNGNGVFDSDKERFYYVADLDTNSKYAVLIYAYTTVNGVAISSGTINVMYNTAGVSNLGPVDIVSQLPSGSQWSKIRLYNYRRQLKNENGTLTSGGLNLPVFKYTNLTSRLLTYQEVYKACNNGYSWQKQCEYLYEHTSYDSTNYPANWGLFLENPVSNNSARVVRLDSNQLNTGSTYEANNEHFAAKPVIEVPKSRME